MPKRDYRRILGPFFFFFYLSVLYYNEAILVILYSYLEY